MILTGIGEENISSFGSVIPRREISGDKLAAGAIEDDKAVAAAVFSEDEGVVLYDRYTNYLKVNNVKDNGMNAQVEAFEQRRIPETEVMSQRRTFQEQDREQ